MQTVAERREQWRAIDDAQLTPALHADDPRWIRDEFDAIIAAEWPAPTTNPPRLNVAVAEDPAGARDKRTAGNAASAVLPWRSRGPGTDGWARERSPPRPKRGTPPDMGPR